MTRPRRKRTLRSQSCTVPCLVQWSSILRQRRDETWSMWNLTWVMLYLDVTSLINHTYSRPGPFRAVGVVSLPPFLPPSLPPSFVWLFIARLYYEREWLFGTCKVLFHGIKMCGAPVVCYLFMCQSRATTGDNGVASRIYLHIPAETYTFV